LFLDGVSEVPTSARLDVGSGFGRSPVTWFLPATTDAGPSHVLVLLDVSGSMKSADMSAVRNGVAAFVRGLPDATWVAIAPFESHRVADRVRAAQFTGPLDAARALGTLPEPQPKFNTGLYTAVREGARALTASGAPGEAHLVVVTDGKNDVHPERGDDNGLLVGDAGRDTAVAAAEQESVHVWMVGIGSAPVPSELAALAGSDDRFWTVASDFAPVSRALQDIAERIGGRNRLVVGTAAAPALALSALPRTIHAIVRDRGVVRQIVGEWRPPLLAPPIAVDYRPELYGPAGTQAGGAILWWRWALLLTPLGLVLMVAVPVSLGMEVGAAETAVVPGARGSPGAVRPSVQEARPRTPDEVTATGVERIVRVPGRS
jgi:hypothetical protein